MNRPAPKLVVAGIAAAALGGGIFLLAETQAGKRSPTRQGHARQVRPAHGLMLFPLADPDAHGPTAAVDR